MTRALFYALICATLILAAESPTGFAQQSTLTEIAGGGGGNAFSDSEFVVGGRVQEVQIRAGDAIDAVQMLFTLSDGRTVTGRRHGGSGGRLNVFRLERGEYIVGISGRYGDTVDSLRIHTNRRTSPTYGGRGGDRDYRIDVPSGYMAVGFTGRSGNLVDAIGLVTAPIRQSILDTLGQSQTGQTGQTAISGGRGGSPFADQELQQGGAIVEIRVRAGDTIDSIQIAYTLADGRVYEGARHGGSGGRLNVFRLESGEYIVGLSGRYGDTIDSLRIHTNRRTSDTFGGRGGDHDFRIDVPSGSRATGFTGRSGDTLDAVGLTYTAIGTDLRRFWPRRRTRP